MMQQLAQQLLQLVAFAAYLWRRFLDDQCPRAAAALAYTSLLALVPLFTIAVVTLSAFPAFDTLRQDIEVFTFENFVPAFGSTVRGYLLEFAGKARGLTGAGIAILVVTVLAMLATIETSFNVIWRVDRKRSIWTRAVVYWTVVTLGPLLIGIGLVVTSYLVSLPLLAAAETTYGIRGRLLAALPVVSTALAFIIVFKVVPNRPVPLRNAVVGGLTAAILFELAKRAFAWYVISVPGQTAIYGAFATLPVFLAWLYLCWTIVLFGAEITHCLPVYRVLLRQRRRGGRHDDFYCAFRVLVRLYEAQAQGTALSEADLLRREPDFHHAELMRALRYLEGARWVARDDLHRWLLARDLDQLTVLDLLGVAPSTLFGATAADIPRGDARDARLADVMQRLDAGLREHLRQPLAGLMSDT